MLEKTKVWYSISNNGDGSASPNWWLSEEEAEWEQDNMDEGWGEPCTGSVETFIGSDIHKEASDAREMQQKLYKAKKQGVKFEKGEYGDDFKLFTLEEKDKNLEFLNEKPLDAWDL